MVLLISLSELSRLLLICQGGPTGEGGMAGLVEGGPEDGHNGVPLVLVEETLVLEDDVRHGGQVAIQ